MATSCEQASARLSEARSAYHTMLTTGAIRTLVDQNGERIEYSVSSPTRLLNYIAQLESDVETYCHGSGSKTRGPLRFFL